ncbi:TPA: phage tail protein [Neisseria meningitidis]
MGGKSGGGAATPYEAPNTLNSAQSLRVVDAVCEGEIKGFAYGNDEPWKSVFFDDTPVQNQDGSFNFKGVAGFFLRGTPDQGYIPGFDAVERTVSVGVEVKKRAAAVRAVTDARVSGLRVTVGVERNAHTQDNGDTLAAQTALVVELVGNSGVAKSLSVSFTEKSGGVYYEDVLFDELPSTPFNIRVIRATEDSSSDRVQNKTFFASYTEITDAKLSYPYTAIAAIAADSDQFGSNNPRRNYLIDGMLLNVPSNYDPATRTYSSAVWDGSFKKAWSDNPAWVFYDVLTQPRYSTLARRLKVSDIDKWTLYRIAKYCDELVDDGFGGKEPRFSVNAYLSERRQAGELLNDLASVFRGLPVWNGQSFSLVMDADSDPVAIYANANVKDGQFIYSGAALKSVTTAALVQYADRHDGWRMKTEYVQNNEAVRRYGLNVKQVQAFGCSSRGQAARFGEWLIQTALRQQETVTFSVGREGLRHLPYDVIQIADNDYAGAQIAGRVQAVKTYNNGKRKLLTLDRAFTQRGWFKVSLSDGATVRMQNAYATVYAGGVSKNEIELSDASVPVSEGDVWAIHGSVKPRLFRVIATKDNGDGTFEVSAVSHAPDKYADVDASASFSAESRTTLHDRLARPSLPEIEEREGSAVLSWDTEAASGEILDYDVKVFRNGKLYRHIPDAKSADVGLENLPLGSYRAEIRSRNARGVLSDAAVKSWTIDYGVNTLQTVAKFNAIDLSWNVPQVAVNALNTEIWYGTTADVQGMKRLAVLPYPQNTYTMAGVAVTDVYYFAVRIVDAHGNSGEYSSVVSGRSDPNPAPVLAQIQGQIGRDTLSDTLWNEFGIETDQRARAESARLRGELVPQINAASSKANQAETKAGQAQTAANAASGKAEQAQTAANAASGKAEQAQTAANAASGKAEQAESKAQQAQNKAEETAQALTQLQRGLLSEERVNELIRNSVPSASNASSVLDTRNDNRPPSWYWANYPKQTVSEFKQLSRIGLNLTGIGAYGVLTTETGWSDPTGASITQILRVSDGNVYYRVSDVVFTRNANRTFNYTKDAWSAWNAMETAVSAERRAEVIKTVADSAKKRADEAYKLAEQAKKSVEQNEVTLREIDRKVTQFGKDSQAVATTVANLENATRSTLTIKTEAQTASGQKVVTGISQTADGITNTTKVTILADKLEVVSANRGNPVQPFVVKTINGRAQVGINGDLVADGTIQGRHIAAGQTLQSPTIVAGALRMGTFSMNADGSFESSAKEGAAGMSLFQYGLVIRDEKGRIRVVLGNRDKLK